MWNKLKLYWNNPENWKPYDWGTHIKSMDSQQINLWVRIFVFIFIMFLMSIRQTV